MAPTTAAPDLNAAEATRTAENTLEAPETLPEIAGRVPKIPVAVQEIAATVPETVGVAPETAATLPAGKFTDGSFWHLRLR